MEALGHLSSGLCCPKLPPPAHFMRFCVTNHAGVSNNGAPANLGTSTFSASKWADRLFSDFQFYPTADSSSSSSSAASTFTSLPPSFAPPDRHVSILLNFYRVIGAETHFLGDGIRRAFEARVSRPPQYGYSQDALISQRQILQAACETLSNASSRREYNLGLADAEEETILTDVPFDKNSFNYKG